MNWWWWQQEAARLRREQQYAASRERIAIADRRRQPVVPLRPIIMSSCRVGVPAEEAKEDGVHERPC
jgi:hypothetical protein